jgi:hypothetical protein
MTAEPSPGDTEKQWNSTGRAGGASRLHTTYHVLGKSCICRELASPVPQFGYFHGSGRMKKSEKK